MHFLIIQLMVSVFIVPLPNICMITCRLYIGGTVKTPTTGLMITCRLFISGAVKTTPQAEYRYDYLPIVYKA